MPTNEHLVLCGGASAKPRGDEKPLNLNLHGASANVRLEIEDISRRLLANLSDVHADLLEIASYIYAADSAISRGGKTDSHLGAMWRRKFRFVIPVRQPDCGHPTLSWRLSSRRSVSCLTTTMSLSSANSKILPRWKAIFRFPAQKDAKFTPDEVLLFSGGLDSFAGTVEELVAHGKKVALVSHRSASKITEAQNYLIGQLRRPLRGGPCPSCSGSRQSQGRSGQRADASDALISIRSNRRRDGSAVGPSAHLLLRKWRGEFEFAAGRPSRRSQGNANHAPSGVSWISAHPVREFSVNPSMSATRMPG